jgi:hypothetical protein
LDGLVRFVIGSFEFAVRPVVGIGLVIEALFATGQRTRATKWIARLFNDSLPDQCALNDGRVEFRGIDPQ